MFFKEKKLSNQNREHRIRDRRVYLANERTFLAWVRTAIGIMAFGFIVEKLSIKNLDEIASPISCYCMVYIGGFLVVLGVFVIVLAAYRFVRTERDIAEGRFSPSLAPDLLLAALLVSASLLLLVYLFSLGPV